MFKRNLDKALLLAAPTLLLILFFLTMRIDKGIATVSAISSLGILIGLIAYIRSQHLIKKYPIEALIERNGETMVFHPIHGAVKEPLQVNIDAIYAINISYHYVGVILDNNGQGFDFHYPHKKDVIKQRLQALLGEDIFSKIKSNIKTSA